MMSLSELVQIHEQRKEFLEESLEKVENKENRELLAITEHLIRTNKAKLSGHASTMEELSGFIKKIEHYAYLYMENHGIDMVLLEEDQLNYIHKLVREHEYELAGSFLFSFVEEQLQK